MQPLIVIVCQDQTIRYKTLPFQSRLKRIETERNANSTEFIGHFVPT